MQAWLITLKKEWNFQIFIVNLGTVFYEQIVYFSQAYEPEHITCLELTRTYNVLQISVSK